MQTITKKTVSIEFAGKRHVLPDDVTIAMFLSQIGLPEDIPVIMKSTKEGFLVIPQTGKN